MFERKTVFVLGAGTSFEIGFPVGAGLRDQMISLLDITYDGHEQQSGDRQIARAIERYCAVSNRQHGNENAYLQAGWRIRDSMPLAISIDNFLEAHGTDNGIQVMGKLGITRAILEAESTTPLAITSQRPKIDMAALAPTWYGGLVRSLTEGISLGSIDCVFENVSFITFNYDRSLEQFLSYALSAYYHIPVESSQILVTGANIIHPYGTVGWLPWQARSNPVIPYGLVSIDLLVEAASQIRTFTESIDDPRVLAQIHDLLVEADQVIFLGFAYHRQNLRLLAPPVGLSTPFKRLLGTSFGISASDESIIRKEVARLFRYRVGALDDHISERFEMAGMTCNEFMAAYHRTITS